MRLYRFWQILIRTLGSAVTAAAALCFLFLQDGNAVLDWLYILIPAFAVVNILPFFLYLVYIPSRESLPGGGLMSRLSGQRLRFCAHGLDMLHIFLWSAAGAVTVHLIRLPMLWRGEWQTWLISAGVAILVEAFVFWNGMLCLYLCSGDLGLRWRIIGAICGLIPILQWIVLYKIMQTVRREIEIEYDRIKRNRARRAQKICETQYPILLVHGVFFRDTKKFCYWGRIPAELEINGATVYYGNQPSAASVRDSARFLADRIREIVDTTGCGKLNIIAHSKGGLDIRAALAFEDIAPYVASVTTVNTPHKGCKFADFLLTTASESFRTKVSSTYNAAARLLGDKDPDFMAAVTDLTAANCAAFNAATEGDAAHTDGILCRSIHSHLERLTGGQFPLNCTYLLAKWFDGPNDGLVSDDSATWGESHLLLTPTEKRGISHGDMIDLNRENIPGFDVREFYVQWVADLKTRGL